MSRSERHALSHAQQRMWFLHHLDPASSAYTLVAPHRLIGPLDAAVLRRAFEALLERQEALRSVFPAADGVPYQEIRPTPRFELPVDDLTAMEPGAQQRALRSLIVAETERHFDLANGPLFAARLVRLGPTDHAVIVSLHHIVSDGWSMGVFWRELDTFYDAFTRACTADLAPLGMRYVDYAEAQRVRHAGEALEQGLAYWRQRLAGGPERIELPWKTTRPPIQGTGCARVDVEMDSEAAERVRELARRNGSTLFMTLCAVFRALLARYSGQSDIFIGTPVANRTQRDVEGLVGLFANTIVLRNDVRPEDSFAQLLSRERQIALEAYSHQSVPFELVVDALGVRRSLAQTPLFQVMFATMRRDPRTFAGIRSEPIVLPSERGVFDLTLTTFLVGGQLKFSFVYRTDVLDREIVEQMARHYLLLLEQAAQDPERRPSRVSLVGPGSGAAIGDRRPRTASDEARYSAWLHDRVDTAARLKPAAIALERDDEQLTYRELTERSNRLAHALLAAGAGRDQPVGVLLDRSLELVVSLLAVLKAGAAYVPLDPDHPAERIRTIVERCRIRLVVGDSRSAELIAGTGTIGIWLDRAESIDHHPGSRPDVIVDGDQLAYILFTSGSTGHPKGVMISHRAVANLIAWMEDEVPLQWRDKVLLKTPATFDASGWELWGPLTAGTTLTIARPGGHREPGYLVDTIRRQRVTTLQTVPTQLSRLIEEPGVEQAGLERVLSGGEALTPDLVARFHQRLSCELINLYGPTETTINASLWRSSDRTPAMVPIGQASANTRLHVLDAQLEPAPDGVAGELYIAGAQVARGYVNAPALTAERFLPDPFSPVPGGRMYRTGDRVRRLADGDIEFLGRLDDQVKIRGFRIELGEIQAVLLEHADVRAGAVIVVDSPARGPELVAYVVSRDARPGVDALRSHLARRLPDYMLPSAFVFVPVLPMTRHGKLDRAALPPPVRTGSGQDAEAASPLEEILCGIWSQVLGVDHVGVDDDFFALGGQSLLALVTIDRVRSSFGVELPLRTLFENPTIRGLAQAIAAGRAPAGMARPSVAIGRGLVTARCSPIQDRWYRVREANPGAASSPPFRGTTDLTLTGNVDVERLAQSWAAIVERHWSLRTAIHVDGDNIVQTVVDPSPATQLAIHDLRTGAVRLDTCLRELYEGELDLAAGQPVRAGLLIDDDHHRLVISSDHLARDGQSIDLLMADLFAVYAALGADRSAHADTVLGRLDHQYVDWSDHQWRLLAGAYGADLRSFWTDRLTGAPDLELPMDAPAADGVGPGIGCPGAFAADTSAHLRAFCRAERTTVPLVLLAATFALLHRNTGQSDLCIAVPTSARTDAVARVVGHFTLPLIIRVQIHPGLRFLELCHAVKNAMLEAYEWRHAPLYAATVARRGLWRLAVNYQRRTPPSNRATDLRIRQSAARYEQVTYADMDLFLYIAEAGPTQLSLQLLGRADGFRANALQRLMDDYIQLTSDMLATPDQRVSR